MNGWSPSSNLKKNGLAAVGASVTNQEISEVFPITAGGAVEGMVVKIAVSGVTLATAITAKLQTAIDAEFVDSKTVAITANGNFYIKLLGNAAADQTFLPLLRSGRLVITTGAGDAVTIDSIKVLQEL